MVSANRIREKEKKYYSNTFNRLPLVIEHGKGVYVWDTDGKRYLDFNAGIAVNALGHAHPRIVKVIGEQSKKLMHTSNWFYSIPQVELAEKLVKLTGLDRVFVTNDGTESIETAIKLVVKATGKKEIISTKNAFHGRTLGSLKLTWGEKYKKPYMPLLEGTKFVDYGDADALRKGINEKTAAVIIEPIQGEAGVIIPPNGYLREVREICDEKNLLLVFDEVQTGFGRTGKMFAFEHERVKPDILCLAKALGGGFPIGAAVFREDLDFLPGEHGGTFVGNPLACSVAIEVINTIVEDKLVENAKIMGKKLLSALEYEGISARGRGLMIGIPVKDGRKTVLDLIEKGVLTIYSENVVRVLPPLIIGKKHIDEFVRAMADIKPARY